MRLITRVIISCEINRRTRKCISLLVFYLLIFLPESHSTENNCESFHETVTGHSKNVSVQWKTNSNQDTSIVLSKPACFTADNILQLKICRENQWLPANSSCTTAEMNRKCPENFIEHDNICTLVTKPNPGGDNNCPFPGSFYTNVAIVDNLWFPIRRDGDFDSFLYNRLGEDYGSVYHEESLDEHANLNCMLKTNYGFERMNCNSLYPHVCSYKYDHFLYNCPANCVPGGLGSDYCFCKYAKSSKCILASARYQRERKIIQQLAGDDQCRIADIQHNSNLQHLNTSDLQVVADKDSWSLLNKNDVQCSICTIKAPSFVEAKIQLQFKPEKEKLFLLIYYPDSLFKDNADNIVYCFTDANDRFRTKVDLEEVWTYRFSDFTTPNSSQPLLVYELEIEDKYPGNYWCEAFQLPHVKKMESNVVVAYQKSRGNEYTCRLVLKDFCRFSKKECTQISFSDLEEAVKDLLRSNRYVRKFVKHIRIMRIYSIRKSSGFADVLIHLTMERPKSVTEEYYKLRGILTGYVRKHEEFVAIEFFRNSDYCIGETSVHRTVNFTWKTTAIGQSVLPEELFTQSDGKPIRRRCLGDFLHGGKWSKIEGDTAHIRNVSNTTRFLHDLISTNATIEMDDITVITQKLSRMSIADVYFLAKILLKFAKEEDNHTINLYTNITELMDHLIKINGTILHEAQDMLNSANDILYAFEKLFNYIEFTDDLLVLKKSNLMVHISKPFVNNISGFLLTNQTMENIKSTTNVSSLLSRDDIDVAAFVPERLLTLMFSNASEEEKSRVKVVTTVFYKDNLFVRNSSAKEVAGRVVSVTIPGYGTFLHYPVFVVFKLHEQPVAKECAFWNIKSTNANTHWSTMGGYAMDLPRNSSLEVCAYTHLTHFALLIMNDKVSVSEDANVQIAFEISLPLNHNMALSVITVIGSCLSFFGIVGIFLTAIIFQSYRAKIGTKILLQLCVAILLENIVIYMADFEGAVAKMSVGVCTLIGVFLHYAVLSKFCWMLVTALLQFFRFVKVLGPVPPRLILKASLFGWLTPTVPIAVLLSIDPQNYSLGTRGFCYPKDLALYLSVLLPIVVAVIANLAVFILVIHSVFRNNTQAFCQNDHHIFKRQLCLAVLLFFLLGIPWIFGVIAEILTNNSFLQIAFMYLLCSTATMQGFILFLFYVVLDASTRKLWRSLLKATFSKNRLK